MKMKRIQKILAGRGITQSKFAVAAGLSPFRFSRLMHGRARMRPVDRRQISRGLRLPADRIFGPRRHRRRSANKKAQSD